MKGFSLIETLIAMIIASVFLFPLSAWFYRRTENQAATEKFMATQILENRLQRAYLLKPHSVFLEQMSAAPFLQIKIDIVKDGKETILRGIASNKQGKVISQLQMDYFIP